VLINCSVAVKKCRVVRGIDGGCRRKTINMAALSSLRTPRLVKASGLLAAAFICGCGTPRMALEGNVMPEQQVTSNLHVVSPRSAYDIGPKFKRGFAPYFPDDEARKRQWGYAMSEFTVDADGRVDDIKIINATAFGFAKEAYLCVQDWRFVPASKNGSAVPVRVRVPFTFRLSH
jgi:TonB family protein